MRALVTGGGGFIGSHLARGLLERGLDVRVLDNFSTGRQENLIEIAGDLEIVEGDIQSYERVHNAVRDCEVVFHQAALPSVPRSVQDPLTTNAVNVVGTLNVLLASRDSGVQRVVFASSSSVYGANDVLPKSERLVPLPMSPYAVGKLAGEGYCRSFSTIYGLETVALRYFNVFGPRQNLLSQYAAVVPNFVVAALHGERPIIYGDGEQSRDFTHVDNVVAANIAAAEAPGVAGQVFNIATGRQISLNELALRLGSLLDITLEPVYTESRGGDVRHSVADISEARQHLGYTPNVGFDDGLASTLAAIAREDARLVRSDGGG